MHPPSIFGGNGNNMSIMTFYKYICTKSIIKYGIIIIQKKKEKGKKKDRIVFEGRWGRELLFVMKHIKL